MKHLILIDGYGFVFRAYHSMPPLTDPEGTPVGAVYGFANMLIKLKKDIEADHIVVVLDAGKDTFRNEIYKEYKANRPPAPDDLIPQFPLVREVAKAFNYCVAEMVGYEADDVIATYAKEAEKQGAKVTIVSSDKDLMQLVDDNIAMYDAMKSKRIEAEQVREKFQVEPDKVLDVLSLMGDSSDNVPGVPGIGPKTAAELINQFGSLEEVLERAEEVKQNKRRESLITYKEQALLSKELITLCETVPLPFSFEECEVRDPDPETLVPFLEKHGFTSLLARLPKDYGIDPAAMLTSSKPAKKQEVKQQKKAVKGQVIKEVKALEAFVDQCLYHGKVALSGIYQESHLVGLALATEGSAVYIPFAPAKSAQGGFDFDEPATAGGIVVDDCKAPLERLLTHRSILKVAHDAKQLIRSLALYTHVSNGNALTPWDDVMVMSYVLDASGRTHDLAAIYGAYGDKETQVSEVLEKIAYHIKGGKGVAPLFELEDKELVELFTVQSTTVLAMAERLRQQLIDHHMLTVYETLDRPLISVLAVMETEGMQVDPMVLKNLSEDFAKRLDVLEKEIHKLAGHAFNVGSPKQLGEVLFDEMGIQGGKKSAKTGAYSTGVEVLESLDVGGHEIAGKVLEWRQLSKLRSTYTEALSKQISPETGRIHSHFSMVTTTTGRLSSSDPNLQNIPVRTIEGQKIREAFVAPKGKKLISADYSQIELRILANMANIESLQEAFAKGQDIHAATASEIFQTPIEGMDPLIRRRAKAINFGIIYGISAFGLARQIGVSRSEAAEFIEHYYARYPGIRAFMEETKEFAHKHGYVNTLFGRKCVINGINDHNPARKNFAERAAINAPLQGTAADIIKHAMVRIPTMLTKAGLDTVMVLQIHDELVFEAVEKDAEKAASMIKQEMEQAVQFDVPLVVDARVGNNLAEIH